jgi:hypothetical protein
MTTTSTATIAAGESGGAAGPTGGGCDHKLGGDGLAMAILRAIGGEGRL